MADRKRSKRCQMGGEETRLPDASMYDDRGILMGCFRSERKVCLFIFTLVYIVSYERSD